MMTGSKLGHYEINQPIGSGGMGEVYRALDTRLQRAVAVKLLSEDLADASARRRFQREAQMASSLNHPHIVTIHDVGEYNGRQYLVAEFVDGGTLRDWIQGESHSWKQVLDLLTGVADGLAAAHEAGILHRDIKPANILISKAGYAKLADFGLAKLIELTASTTNREALTEATRTGLVIGTVAYMSPEQASGKPLDSRSDIFSFGVVLYEALVGQRPFNAGTDLELLQAINHRAPAPLGESFPISLWLAVEKALEKDPADRYQSMRELVVDLRRILRRESAIAERPTPVVPITPRRWLWIAPLVLGSLAVGALASWLWVFASGHAIPAMVRQQRLTEFRGMEQTPAISPDGKSVVFTALVDGKRQIFSRLRATGGPVPITKDNVDHYFPRWADEDNLIYFRPGNQLDDSGDLWEIPRVGGTPRIITDSAGEGDVSHDGRLIATFRTDGEGQALVIIERRTGKTEQTIRLPEATYGHRSPRWSPNDRQIAFESRLNLSTTRISVMNYPGNELRVVASPAQTRGITWLPDSSGFVVASSDGSTMAYPPIFSLVRVPLNGRSEPLLVGNDGYDSYVEPDINVSGAMVVSRVRMQSDIYRYPIDGTAAQNVQNARQITRQTGQVQTPSVSPRGNEVAYLSDSSGHANIWVASVEGSEPPRQITFEDDPSVVVGIPRWSPKGDRIVFIKQPVGGALQEWLVRPDGSDLEFLVAPAAGANWSHDGEWLYYFVPGEKDSCTYKIRVPSNGSPQTLVRCGAMGTMVTADGSTGYFQHSQSRGDEVWKARPLETGESKRLVNVRGRLPSQPHQFDLSPNDLWLAVPLKDQETTNLWKVDTKDGSLHQITDFGQRATLIARQVSWSRDSKYIFAALLETDADVVLIDGALQAGRR
jgi:Tol biopolymer transport system component